MALVFRPNRIMALSVLALLVLGGATILAARSYEQRLDSVRHTVDVQRKLMVVLSDLQDAETGQRGYLLTGKDIYLSPYRAARDQVAIDVAELEKLVADNPEQVRAVDALRPLMRTKFEELDATVALRRQGRDSEALDIIRRDQGLRTMDELRSQLAGMSARETVLLRERIAASRRLSYGLFASLAVLVGAAFAVVLLWLGHARRDARALERAHLAEVDANARLRQEAAERESAEGQVRQLQKMEAVGQLTGGIAHDFNNMLAVIIGNIELARRHSDDAVRLDRRLLAAQDASVRAATLTKRLLAFSRRQALEPRSIDVNGLVAGMSDMLLRTLGETIRIETVLAGGLWRTFADPAQVESAVLNLVVNARDAMPEGGRLTIETANTYLDDDYAALHPEAVAGQYVMVSVTDTGHGMSPDVAAQAFEPFFTTKGPGLGTGLGLSQIYGFAKQTGGHARIYSEPGAGTSVKLYLPRDYAVGRAEPVEALAAEPAPGSPDRLIVVVEDEDSLRRVSVESLRSLGYTVRHAPDGETALRLIEELGSVDLLFTDIVMPGMTGRQLADAAALLRPDLKVLYTTGYTRNAVVHNGVVDPGVALLPKPFTVEQLAAKVAQALH
ncbi:histidine kinase [Caulobacter zeae]|uniref:histidine kinase n=1 Tax=Caulobacter zeae TaxID=2055137 RepID=A0A2N5DDZ1_9CAUL|nr:CHASE3 domain-containing protein [Caulobacter zeae]PLR24279.1 histidine kinase [Caulobacter zeae]